MRKNNIHRNRYSFAGRAAVCYFLVLFLLLSCILRVAVIDTKGYDKVCAQQNEYKIKVNRIRGTIYDCNMLPLTNNKKSIMAIVSPTPRALMAISGELDGKEKENLMKQLRNNKPVVTEVSKEIDCEGIATAYAYKTTGSSESCHVVGYLDNTGHGAVGLEAAYDSILYSDDYLYAVYEADGKGNMLLGSQPRFENSSAALTNGVVSTIDINMQNAVCEAAGRFIKKGAVVVAEAQTGEIKVILSFPRFDTSNISTYLDDVDSPFLNRALAAYNVGSVFKSCVAAAGIKKRVEGYKCNCTGSTYIADRYFKCHKSDGHGTVDLRQALAFSCNCFFYGFASEIGGEEIYKQARVLEFGAAVRIADNIKTSSGNLPDVNTLSNPAHLANFSIGQGELTASPVSLLPLYMSIANKGEYYIPSLVKKTIKDGKEIKYNKGYPTVAMSEETAEMLKTYLADVITEGTASSAAPKTVTAAGKTATAQTGKTGENGEKINNSWFCGFFPADKPQYVAVLLSEGGNSSDTTAAFAEIADIIAQMS
ncbi:MAG: penicillin-binding protein 2 [Clostridia bacterium]|nr:penicillin-binding protein 2 [Clostridia bacterium]